MNRKPVLLLASLLSVTLLAFGLLAGPGNVSAQDQEGERQSSPETPAAPTQTLYDVIQSEPTLASFEALVEAAGLHDNLQQDGPFTIFAPTNEAWSAFETMAAGTDATMTEILLYHVLNGEYPAASLTHRRALPTLSGKHLFLDTTTAGASFGLTLNETANVVRTDIQATNGVVHVIDDVVPLPEGNTLFASNQGMPDATIAQVLAADGRFDTFLSLAQQAGLMGQLENAAATYTVFAPTDEAFAAVPEEMMEQWLSDPHGALRTILSYHIVGDRLSINQIATDHYLPTLEGRALAVTTDEDVRVYLNGRPVQAFNLLAANGLVHVVDEVIMP